MVEIEALQSFVTILGDDCVSAVKDERVHVPKDRADKLVAAGFAKFVEPETEPEPEKPKPAQNKRVKQAPENKADAPEAPTA